MNDAKHMERILIILGDKSVSWSTKPPLFSLPGLVNIQQMQIIHQANAYLYPKILALCWNQKADYPGQYADNCKHSTL